MDLRKLEYFLAAVQRSSFKAAAEQVHVSAPALTKGIQALEQDLEAGQARVGGDREALRVRVELPVQQESHAEERPQAQVADVGRGWDGDFRRWAVDEEEVVSGIAEVGQGDRASGDWIARDLESRVTMSLPRLNQVP